METKGEKRHYAWTIVICCVLIYFTTSVVTVSLGNFISPVVNDFGIQVRQLTLTNSIECAVMAVLYPVAGKVLNTKKLSIVVPSALLLMLLGMFLMGSYHSVYGFYLSGVMIGIGSAFTQFLAMPLIINMWFRKKTGTALGICVSCGTAFGILFNLVSAQLIVRLGWRAAYHILPLIPLVVALPYVVTHLKSPAEMGCKPYGAEEAEKEILENPDAGKTWGVTRKQAFRLPMLYFAWLVCLCYSVGSSVPNYIPTFATMELGTSVELGAIAFSLYSVGSVCCGFLLGKVNDRYGVKAGMTWGMVFMILGMGGLMLSIQNSSFLVPTCFITGFGGLNMYSVQAPLVARTVVGDRHYSDIWAVLMIGNSMIAALVYSPIGGIFDATGSFTGAFLLGMIMFTAALFFGVIALNMSRKYREAHGISLK